MSRAETAAALAALAAAPSLILPFLRLWNKKPQPIEPSEKTPDFSDKLQAQLLDLSIQSYEQLIAQVLRAVGYENVRVLRDPCPSRRSHKGRNRHGGFDHAALWMNCAERCCARKRAKGC